jgi:hypothetical protein
MSGFGGRAGSVAIWNGMPPLPMALRSVPRMLSLRLR